MVTVTCNSSGGQPVSMENLRKTYEIASKYNVPVFFDSARFAENAYFIKIREDGYQEKSIKEIVKEMYQYADGMTMSAKKDGIVNMGGLIGFKDEDLFKQTSQFDIMFEGFITYGGMAGRDMNALAVGLNEVTEFDYLQTRIKQTQYLGQRLMGFGIPVQQPIGGHAVYIDAKRFLPSVAREQYVAQTLALELYIEGGVRGVEIGTILADRDPITGENRYPELEMVRLAIPRRVYTNNHMDVVAITCKNVFDRKDAIVRGYSIVTEQQHLRHFTVTLKKRFSPCQPVLTVMAAKKWKNAMQSKRTEKEQDDVEVTKVE